MSLKKGETVTIPIHDLAFGGNGVGRIERDGKPYVVFVEGAVPGDIVEARLTNLKSAFGEAQLVTITKPSGQRITPRCRHFNHCGGCSLQMLPYAEQLIWKQKMVADSLRRIGGFEETAVQPILGCEDPWFYRNKMEYSFGMQWEEDLQHASTATYTAGLHPKKNFSKVFDLKECFLQSTESVAILHAVKEWAHENKITFFDAKTNEGVLKSLYVREGKNTGERMVNLVTNGRDFKEEKQFTTFLTEEFPSVTSLYRTAVTVKKGFKTNIEEFHLAGRETLVEELRVVLDDVEKSLSFDILPQAFFQPNTLQAQILYGEVLASATEAGTKRAVLDLFCGTGTIGMFFAQRGAHVVGIDNNASAIENARANAKRNELSTIDFMCGDAFVTLNAPGSPAAKHKYSLIITDPPRAGIDPKALEKILTLKIPEWIYVSCNPTTLARDLKVICGQGYRLDSVQPVDMFPHTYHVETVCHLTKI